MPHEDRERDMILRVVWPPGTSESMLNEPYQKRCEDCGVQILTRDIHLRIKHLGGKKKQATLLCPVCGPKRGKVQDMVMRRKEASDEAAQKSSEPSKGRIITASEFKSMAERNPGFAAAASYIRHLAIQEINDKVK